MDERFPVIIIRAMLIDECLRLAISQIPYFLDKRPGHLFVETIFRGGLNRGGALIRGRALIKKSTF